MLNQLSHPGAPEATLFLQCNFIFFNVYLFIYLLIYFEREGQDSLFETIREGEKDSQVGFVLSAQNPMWDWIPRTVRSWPEPKSRVRHLTD